MSSHTPWQQTRISKYPQLWQDREFDVVVVGGGITGLSAAYFLKQAGVSVCVLERDRLGKGDTGCTTAHLTQVTDMRLRELVRTFGRDAATLLWNGGRAAISTIEKIASNENIRCDFRRVPGFVHAALRGTRDESEELRAEASLALELGFQATFVESLPILGKPAVRYDGQALFQPRAYLAALAKAVDGGDCAIFEHTEVSEIEGPDNTVIANDFRVRCRHVFIATHVPKMGKTSLLSATLLQTKLAPYSTYAIGAKLPQGILPDASYWDTSDPYYYLRVDHRRANDYVIFGGEDHKTGQEPDTEARTKRLETLLLEILPQAQLDCHWSGQVVETNDGLPYIGETAERQFVATGFAGNGMTFGTLAAMIVCDRVLGRDNPWRELLDVGRKKLNGGTWDFVKENLDYPYFLIRDRLASPEGTSTRSVRRGEGKILQLDGQRVACSRDAQGKLSMVSPICTHMGCLVHWNSAEETWDCPCHGSRFQATGEVLAGPAEIPLADLRKPAPRRELARQG